MPRLLLILTLLGSQCVFGQSLHFGTNRIAPGETLRFTTRVGAKGQAELSRIGMLTATAQGALVLPANCTNLIKPCPLLVASVPSGGSALSAMPSVTNIALSQGWAVLAADGPRIAADQDTIQFGWAILSSVLDHVARTWPPAKQWPVACAGFSGGAKRSAVVAGAMMKDGW